MGNGGEVSFELTFAGEPELSVDHGEAGITVIAHAGLSEGQVKAACAHLEPEVGERVFNVWSQRVLGAPKPSAS